jgi:uncharacterized iron-regulated membrane protein
MRLPQPGGNQATVMIEEAQSWHPYPRSILTLDLATAAVVKWEPYEGYNLGRTIRSWVRPVYTGEAGGLLGQIVAALASAGGRYCSIPDWLWCGGASGNLSDGVATAARRRT